MWLYNFASQLIKKEKVELGVAHTSRKPNNLMVAISVQLQSETDLDSTFIYLYPLVSYSLIMCGVLAAMFEHYEEAQTFLERATNIQPPSVVAWTLLGEMGFCIST